MLRLSPGKPAGSLTGGASVREHSSRRCDDRRALPSPYRAWRGLAPTWRALTCLTRFPLPGPASRRPKRREKHPSARRMYRRPACNISLRRRAVSRAEPVSLPDLATLRLPCLIALENLETPALVPRKPIGLQQRRCVRILGITEHALDRPGFEE